MLYFSHSAFELNLNKRDYNLALYPGRDGKATNSHIHLLQKASPPPKVATMRS